MNQPAPLISPLPSALRYGLAVSAILSISTWVSTTQAVANHSPINQAVNYTQIGIILMALVLAMLHHRRQFAGRTMKYTEALGAGIITALLGGVLLALFTFLFFWLNDDLRIGLEQIAFDALSSEEKKTSLELTKGMTTFNKVAGSAMYAFSMMMFYGLLGSLCLAIFVQRKATDQSKI